MNLFKTFLFISMLSALTSRCFADTLSLVAVNDYKKVEAYKEGVEFVVLAIEDAGIKVKVIEAPRKRGALAVDNGTYDALPFRGLDDAKELPNVITTSFPMAFTIFRVVSLVNNKKFVESTLKDFSGAIVLNNASLESEVHKRSLHVSEVNVNYPDLVKMLMSGRVDYIIVPEELIASLFDQEKSLIKLLKVSDNVFVKTPLYFSMNKKHRGMMAKIEKSLRKALTGDISRYKYIRNSLNRKLEH